VKTENRKVKSRIPKRKKKIRHIGDCLTTTDFYDIMNQLLNRGVVDEKQFTENMTYLSNYVFPTEIFEIDENIDEKFKSFIIQNYKENRQIMYLAKKVADKLYTSKKIFKEETRKKTLVNQEEQKYQDIKDFISKKYKLFTKRRRILMFNIAKKFIDYFNNPYIEKCESIERVYYDKFKNNNNKYRTKFVCLLRLLNRHKRFATRVMNGDISINTLPDLDETNFCNPKAFIRCKRITCNSVNIDISDSHTAKIFYCKDCGFKWKK